LAFIGAYLTAGAIIASRIWRICHKDTEVAEDFDRGTDKLLGKLIVRLRDLGVFGGKMLSAQGIERTRTY
jgi:hypothetical protein